jgi:hypothetical protein
VSNVVSGKNGAAGIAGRNGDNNVASETGAIVNCFNRADISSADGRWFGGITGFQNALSSVNNVYDTGNLLNGYNDYAAIIGQDEGTHAYDYSAPGIPSRGSLAVPGTVVQDMTTQAFLDLLNAQSTALGFGNAWVQGSDGYPDLSYNSDPPTPSGGGGTPNNYDHVYLSNAGSDSNTGGSRGDPVRTPEKALQVASMSTVASVDIVVMNTIAIDSGQRVLGNTIVFVWDGPDSAGPMFRIESGNSLLIGGVQINGNDGRGDITVAVEVESGASFTMRNGAEVLGALTAIQNDGGDVTLNRSRTIGTDYSVYLTDAASTLTLFAGPDQTIDLNGTVYLAGGAFIAVGSEITGGITVECEEAEAGFVVAEVTGDYTAFSAADVAQFSYAGGEFGFAASSDGTQIVLAGLKKK